MANNIDEKGVIFSVEIYQRLLALYPAEFRREYGAAMIQLFRDQCRDSRNLAGGMGLVILWLRVLPDLAKTSFVEHLSNSNRKKSFVRLFALAFVCMFVFSICQMFWTPKVYSSTVRFEIHEDLPGIAATGHGKQAKAHDPYFLTTQFKIIESWSILTNVIATLHLDDKLAAQAGEAHWTMDQTYAALSDKISAGQTRMTSLVEISVRNRDPKLAADIANTLVDSYFDLRCQKLRDAESFRIDVLQRKLGEVYANLLNLETERDKLDSQNQPVFNLDQEVEGLKRNIEGLKKRIQMEMADPGRPMVSTVIVRDPARPVLRPVNPNSAVFLRWMVIGTFAALVAGGAGAWLSYLARRSFHGPSPPT